MRGARGLVMVSICPQARRIFPFLPPFRSIIPYATSREEEVEYSGRNNPRLVRDRPFSRLPSRPLLEVRNLLSGDLVLQFCRHRKKGQLLPDRVGRNQRLELVALAG